MRTWRILRGIIHNQRLFLTSSAWELLVLLFPYSKGSAACCCFWHLIEWKPTVWMLTEYLPLEESTPLRVQKDCFIPSSGFGWHAKNQSHSVLMVGRFGWSNSYTFVSESFCAVVPLFYTTLKPSLQSDTVWLWCLQETYCKFVLLRFRMEIHERIQLW